MKKPIFFVITLVSISLQGCFNDDRGQRDAAATSAIDQTEDTTQRAQNYTADVDINGDEKSFLSQAASGSMGEIAAGNLIIQKSTNPAVKAFAERMVKEHTKANKELEEIAKTKGLVFPNTLSEKQLKEIAAMKELSGRSIDVQYITMMINNHAQTVALYGKATSFKDSALKAFASTNLPVVQMHRKEAIKLGEKLNISNTNNGDDIGIVSSSTSN
jgi:putative membrane protein